MYKIDSIINTKVLMGGSARFASQTCKSSECIFFTPDRTYHLTENPWQIEKQSDSGLSIKNNILIIILHFEVVQVAGYL